MANKNAGERRMRKLVLAIDFDGTFAAAPELFRTFVEAAHAAGHRCILVTQRGQEQRAEVDTLAGSLLPIICASGTTKRMAAKQAGYRVDVWVDDDPESIDTALIYVGRAP
jgi:hypothetical protein